MANLRRSVLALMLVSATAYNCTGLPRTFGDVLAAYDSVAYMNTWDVACMDCILRRWTRNGTFCIRNHNGIFCHFCTSRRNHIVGNGIFCKWIPMEAFAKRRTMEFPQKESQWMFLQ